MNAKSITPAHTRFERQQVAVFLDRCQVLAGRFGELSSSALMSEMNSLVIQLPASLNRVEHSMISSVLSQLLARVVCEAGIDGRADVSKAFWNLANAGSSMDRWRLQWIRMTDCCAEVLLTESETGELQMIDIRVTRMLRLVHTRYVDSTLTMRQVAQTVNICPSHAARLLKQQTGCGFLTHLHRCRILFARRLLVETRLSMKEIAALVGYADPSQFSRHFRIISGTTPLAFRTAEIHRLSA